MLPGLVILKNRAGAYLSRHWVRQGTPWTGSQSITGLTDKATLTFTPMGNEEFLLT